MNLLKKILHNRLNSFIQDKSNRNRAVLEVLRELEFDDPDIRHTLIILNKIKIPDLARDQNISLPTIYNTLKGKRANGDAIRLVSIALDLKTEELFPN